MTDKIDHISRQKFMEERLNGKQWMSNTVGRVAQASMLPNLFDTVSPVPLFNGMRTTSDVSSIASNPTLKMSRNWLLVLLDLQILCKIKTFLWSYKFNIFHVFCDRENEVIAMNIPL